MFKQCIVIICALVVSAVSPVMAYVSFSPDSQSFVVADKASGKVASIWVDPNASPGILLAAKNLQSDIHKVTGLTPVIVHDAQTLSGQVIIIGERGAAAPVDRLFADG